MYWAALGIFVIGAIVGHLTGRRGGVRRGVFMGYWAGRSLERLHHEAPFKPIKATVVIEGQEFEFEAHVEQPMFAPKLHVIDGDKDE